ncbi:hypothetical protein Tco_0636818 [Tanacetum coccineum]
MESRRFIILQTKLSKVIQTQIDRKVKAKVRTGLRNVTNRLDSLRDSIQDNSDCVSGLKQAIKDINFLLEVADVFKKANAEGEKWEKNNPETSKDTNVQRTDVQVEQSVAKENTETAMVAHKSEEDNSGEIISGKNGSEDELPAKKLKVLISTLEILKPTPLSSIILEHLFAPSPPREPTPPRDPENQPMEELIPCIEEGGSNLKSLNIKPFITTEGEISQEEYIEQIKEMKRLADLKATKEESEKSLRKIMNPEAVKARTLKLAEYEEKRVSSSQDATMRITRVHDPLNVKVYKKFRLKTLGFSEWLEVQAKKLGLPPPPELAHFGKPAKEKKRKRTEILAKVFVKENIVVDGMQRNLIPPPGVECRKGLVIKEPEDGIFYFNGNFDLVFQRVSEFHLTITT